MHDRREKEILCSLPSLGVSSEQGWKRGHKHGGNRSGEERELEIV